ncbi:hypothetical protein Bbelb_371070 [Branchiostoma belcheri]|nr:hypothetical protein Bbelb_371070 [Branchiostoma belcheri]
MVASCGGGTSLDYETGRPGFDSGSYPNKSEHAPRRYTLGKGTFHDFPHFTQLRKFGVGAQVSNARLATSRLCESGGSWVLISAHERRGVCRSPQALLTISAHYARRARCARTVSTGN